LARKILLADDSVTAQNMGRKILTDAGYEVVTVNNGSAALKKIIEHKPDLIVLDVYMPGYSGLEVCQRIKENRETARIPVLLTVGKLEPFKPEEARRARADAFVVKPFEASELLAALTKLEDKVIPQPEPYKQGRFAKAVASFDRDTEPAKLADPDEGWKARLRIPTGPPKSRDAEPDPEYAVTQGKGFRDFVEPPAKKNQPKPSAPTGIEPPLPAGIPHDITPEEIAAITAAAAQLSGAAPPFKTVADEVAAKEAVTEAESEATEANPEEASAEENAPVTFASSPEVSEAEPDAVASQIPGEEASAPERVETATAPEEISGAAPPGPEAAITSEIQSSGDEAIAREAQSEAAPVAEEPAPEPAEETVAVPTAETSLPEVISQGSEPSPPASMEVLASEMPATAAGAAPASTSDTADDEVMAALQTLMPSASTSEIDPTNGHPKKEIPFSAAAMAEGIATRAHAAGPRWIAEEVSLASDEATISLEREMEKAYAAVVSEPRAAKASAEVAIDPEMHEAVSIPAADEPQPASAMYAVASATAAGEIAPAQLSRTMQAPAETEVSTTQESSTVVDSIIRPKPVTPVLPETVIETMAAASATETAAADISGENEIVGGTEDMAANWKNIRDSIAGAAAKPAPAKEDFREPELAKSEPEAPASVAASEKAAATDPQAIASIVESVLAELRPKIVEEIARKIAESKKE
jgi:two-component system, chemotaxis family, response regulator PixH